MTWTLASIKRTFFPFCVIVLCQIIAKGLDCLDLQKNIECFLYVLIETESGMFLCLKRSLMLSTELGTYHGWPGERTNLQKYLQTNINSKHSLNLSLFNNTSLTLMKIILHPLQSTNLQL